MNPISHTTSTQISFLYINHRLVQVGAKALLTISFHPCTALFTVHRDHGNSVISHAAQAAGPRTNGTNANMTDIAI